MPTPANFLFEMGMLAKQQRTGFAFLGESKQSIAEHINRVCYVGYVLAKLDGTVNAEKVVTICLFHDMAEARSLDLNYVAQQYVQVDEERIVQDQTKDLPFGEDIRETIGEYEERTSKEAILAKDADNIELLLFLKEQLDTGNKHAQYRIDRCIPRIKTDIGRKLADEITQTTFDNWRRSTQSDDYWIHRKR